MPRPNNFSAGAKPSSSCKRLFSTVGVFRNYSSWLGVLFRMRRRAVVGISAVILLLVIGALLVVCSRSVLLSHGELATKQINPPALWADPDCGRLRRAVRTAVRESDLRIERNVGRLSADEVAVYQAVLHQWNSDAHTLNVANRTFPLDALSSDSSCKCLRNLHVKSLVSASLSFHYLTQTVFPESNVRLVDPDEQLTTVRRNDPHTGMAVGKSVERAVKGAFASGLFSLSEIAFDEEHHLALVSYGFVCGSLCGSGGRLLLEKVDGVWKIKGRECGGWVS